MNGLIHAEEDALTTLGSARATREFAITHVRQEPSADDASAPSDSKART